MRRLVFSVVLLSSLGFGQAARDPAAIGRNALDLLLAGKYAEFNAVLTDAAKELLTTEFLRDRVGAELKGFGTVGAIGEPVKVQAGRNTDLTFPVRFSETNVNIEITLNESLQVAAFH